MTASCSSLRDSLPRPKVYAAGKNAEDNVLYVCFGSDHPALFCDKFYVRAPLHWIAGAAPGPTATEGDLERGLRCQFRSQNKRPLTACLLRSSKSAQGKKDRLIRPVAVLWAQFRTFLRGHLLNCRYLGSPPTCPYQTHTTSL